MRDMNLSAVYICPIRGMAGLEPPDPETLFKAARVGADLGLTRLELPVMEEALDRPRLASAYLDGLVKALDAADQAGMSVELAPLPRHLLELKLGSRNLYKPGENQTQQPVFLEGKIRRLSPLNWWTDPGLLTRHIKLVREIAAALSGHPALKSWLLLDRHWTGLEVGGEALDWLLQALIEEVRSRDESVELRAGLTWTELLRPELTSLLSARLAGFRLAGLNHPPKWFFKGQESGPADELALAAFVAMMGQWLIGLPVSVETGWKWAGPIKDESRDRAALERLAGHLQDSLSLSWPNLVVPLPHRAPEPPWLDDQAFTRLGLLDHTLEPFDWLEPLMENKQTPEPDLDFIDIDTSEFRIDPALHLERLFNHWSASLN